jgi:hypothetical protein
MCRMAAFSHLLGGTCYDASRRCILQKEHELKQDQWRQHCVTPLSSVMLLEATENKTEQDYGIVLSMLWLVIGVARSEVRRHCTIEWVC